MLYLKVVTKSRGRLARIPVPLYVSGSDFWIALSVTNVSAPEFPGGNVRITIAFSGTTLTEQFIAKIPSLALGVTHEIEIENHIWGVLASGHALIYARIEPHPELCDAHHRRIENYHPGFGYHVHSFYSQSRGELYTLVALGMTVLTLIVTLIVNWERLCDWLNQLVRHLADC